MDVLDGCTTTGTVPKSTPMDLIGWTWDYPLEPFVWADRLDDVSEPACRVFGRETGVSVGERIL